MRFTVECHGRLSFIEEVCYELIDGENYNLLDILLYILVKDNDLIVDGFDHRAIGGGELFVAEKVRNIYGKRAMHLPSYVHAVKDPKLSCGFLSMTEVDVRDYWT
ncbi:hypothetical protein [Erwinia phage vB_Ea277G]|jgi:hypothetical protein|nr:hypothetical protein [Erwinia phage vB_Ea277G]